MLEKRKKVKPKRCYVEEVGYNYIISGFFLFPDEWFKSATEFNEEGFAIVESFSKKMMRIDINGKVEELPEGIRV